MSLFESAQALDDVLAVVPQRGRKGALGRGAVGFLESVALHLGVGQVIQGWDQGVQGMKVGGRRKLVIPPDLGYGSRGAGNAIKPGETLIFVCDLVSA